jgi:hypothetical protein
MKFSPASKKASIGLVAAVLLAGCSSSVPRHSAVFSPTPEQATSVPAAAASAAGSPSAIGSVDTSTWIEFAPPGAGFRVLVPNQPTESSAPMKTPVGTASSTSWTYTDSANRVFLTTDVKFASGALSEAPPKTVLDSAATAMVAAVPGARLSAQSDLTLRGHSGRSISYATAQIAVVCQIYIVGDDMNGICSAQPAGRFDESIAQAFFASYELTA